MSETIGLQAVEPATTLGLARLAGRVFENVGVAEILQELLTRSTAAEADAGALLDLATLLVLTGNRDEGLDLQKAAIGMQRFYRRVHGAGGGLRILAFMAAGDLMANTPLDFLLEGSNAELTIVYVDGAPPSPSECPDHDLAFLAIGESGANAPILAALQPYLGAWPRPVVNGRPERIAALTRDGVCAMLTDAPGLLAPAVTLVDRATAEALATGGARVTGLLPGEAFPIIVRPAGSHAGNGLEKIDACADLLPYLARFTDQHYFVTAYVDYSSDDGMFRKLRVVLVLGRPYISHMAVSDHWMVHYLNAGMAESAAKRAEEAQMMATFDQEFAVRHASAFITLYKRIGLDYFGVDCAETKDGRLLVFEADVAMIVHAMDPPDLYPYKGPAMTRLFEGFQAGLKAIAS